MRINRVLNSKKEHTCGKCREVIPKGEVYLWAKGRYGPKMTRCTKPRCRFRPTDLSGAKTAQIYEAIEDARDVITRAIRYEEVTGVLCLVAEIARGVAEEYSEASSAWAGGQNEAFDEKAQECDSFADTCECWEYSGGTDQENIEEMAVADEPARENGETLEQYKERLEEVKADAWDEALELIKQEASEALDEFAL